MWREAVEPPTPRALHRAVQKFRGVVDASFASVTSGANTQSQAGDEIKVGFGTSYRGSFPIARWSVSSTASS